jgi:uncharacterized protein (TIGR02246 family)
MLASLALAVLLAAAPIHPDPQPDPTTPADEAAVLEVVNRLFDGMRARDGAMVASVFHPDARLVTTGAGPDGAPRVQVQAIDGFVTAVGGEGDPWNEPLFHTEVRVDGNLAHVWTFYRFYAGDRFSHCGYNAILLVRGNEGWRIIHLADTRRTDDCDP